MKIAYLAPEIPALSATFVYKEILMLQQLGTEVVSFSVREPSSEATGLELKRLKKGIRILYESKKIAVLLAHFFLLLQRPKSYFLTVKLLLADIKTVGLLSRNALGLIFRFFYAGQLARQLLKSQCTHLHVHFAHVPTDIGMYAAFFSDITFSVTAHANDIFERGWLLKEKVDRSSFFATISEFNKRYLIGLGVNAEKVCIVRCGVDARQFDMRQDFVANKPKKIGAVGRLVEKKGFDSLIKAVALLKKQGEVVELFIAGDGPLQNNLITMVAELGLLESEVHFLGAMPHTLVADFIKSLDVFVLPCKPDSQGDMDGIPVVLMEAMLSGVPVISTELSGIPELVINKTTGLLVSVDNVEELSDAIICVVNDDRLRNKMVEDAISKVEDEFSLQRNVEKLNVMFSA